MKRYLVVGLAKTGTTAISKAIQASFGIERYSLEPKTPAFFASMANQDHDWVVKILYDHWMDRPRLFNALVHDEFRTSFDRNVFIVRDPRAELISRLHYVAWPRFLAKERSREEEQAWIELFRRKESDPSFSLREMLDALQSEHGVNFTRSFQRNAAYARYVSKLPEARRQIVRYEDFAGGTADPALFAVPADVGDELERTNRTGGADDWTAFLTPDDLAWLNGSLKEALEPMGYPLEVQVGGEIDPAHSSRYVEGLIETARKRRKEKAEPR